MRYIQRIIMVLYYSLKREPTQSGYLSFVTKDLSKSRVVNLSLNKLQNICTITTILTLIDMSMGLSEL